MQISSKQNRMDPVVLKLILAFIPDVMVVGLCVGLHSC